MHSRGEGLKKKVSDDVVMLGCIIGVLISESVCCNLVLG